MDQDCYHFKIKAEGRLASLEEWRETHRNQRHHTVAVWVAVIVVTASAVGVLWQHQSDGHPVRVEQRLEYWKEETQILKERIRQLELKSGSDRGDRRDSPD